MNPAPLVVVDTETTGFGKNDRIVEVAAVKVDPTSGDVVDEYDTLINPERDVGARGVHGITASMVEAAPVFSEVIADLGRRLQGAVLVAHNLAFDRRMLAQEFSRHDVHVDFGMGCCTLHWTKKRLNHACEAHGIPLSQHHRALADARATAELLSRLGDRREPDAESAVRVGYIPQKPGLRTLRRETSGDGGGAMHRIVSRAHYPHADEAVLRYLDMLDWVLDDAIIDPQERAAMAELADELGISVAIRQAAHRDYLTAIIDAAKRDGVVTDTEQVLIAQIAEQLDVRDRELPGADRVLASGRLPRGTRVCFTGTVEFDAETVSRAQMEIAAKQAGLQPVRSVTKKNCDVLVAADPSSASGKAAKARQYGIPIMPAGDFLRHHSR